MIEKRAPRNKTIIVGNSEKIDLFSEILELKEKTDFQSINNRLILGDIFQIIDFLPNNFADLLFLDPPYNINKDFGNNKFLSKSVEEYQKWFEKLIKILLPKLKRNSVVYVCSDWLTSASIFPVINNYFIVHNRITWEREKGRGSSKNWKNNSEDIWFASVSEEFYFNPKAVMLKRKVLAPYTDKEKKPKDWLISDKGNFRLTFPSNIWTDITVPFWSMPENTDHPTQKPEKLLAKLILSSTIEGQIVFDPFLGSGTSAVTSKKLNRNFCGVELNSEFILLGQKRLKLADNDKSIQGFENGVFWERNSSPKNYNKNI